MIVIIWLVACAASVPFPVNTRTFFYVDDPRDGAPLADSFVCNIQPDRMAMMNAVLLAEDSRLSWLTIGNDECGFSRVHVRAVRRADVDDCWTLRGDWTDAEATRPRRDGVRLAGDPRRWS